jgi:glucose-6-phosphate 1-dehydrogenase
VPAPESLEYLQYEGYRSIPGVAADSSTETYAALRLEIDNWRWSGVPFFLRTGKCLPITQTELRVVFRRPPRLGFANWSRTPEPSQLIVKMDPSTGIRFLVDAQRHEAIEPEQINLDMEFAQEGGEGPTPYEVLLHAALVGDSKRFTRQDGVEECWRVMAPLLEHPPPVHPYAKGSWGPEAADKVASDDDVGLRDGQQSCPSRATGGWRRKSEKSRRAALWMLAQEPDLNPARVPESTGAPIRRHRRRDHD